MITYDIVPTYKYQIKQMFILYYFVIQEGKSEYDVRVQVMFKLAFSTVTK